MGIIRPSAFETLVRQKAIRVSSSYPKDWNINKQERKIVDNKELLVRVEINAKEGREDGEDQQTQDAGAAQGGHSSSKRGTSPTMGGRTRSTHGLRVLTSSTRSLIWHKMYVV